MKVDCRFFFLILGVFSFFASTSESKNSQKEALHILNYKEGPPQNLTVTAASSRSLNVSWEAPSDIPEYYEVFWTGVGSTGSDLSSDTFYVVDNLLPCEFYTVYVDANYGSNVNRSEEVREQTDIDVPPAPSDLSCIPQEDVIIITWKRPNTKCPIDSYNITWNGTARWSDELEETSSASLEYYAVSYKLNYGIPGAFYHISLWAANEKGEGPVSSCESLSPDGLPSEPVIASALAVNSTAIAVTWTGPDVPNGIITEYSVQYECEKCIAGEVSTSPDSNSTVLNDLIPCTTYTICVSALTSGGEGPCSDPANSSTTDDNIQPPDSATCYQLPSGDIYVNWTSHNGNCLGSFLVDWNATVLWNDTVMAGGDITSDSELLLTDTVPYTDYTVCVSSFELGQETCCSVITEESTPGPVEVKVTDRTIHSLEISWAPPTELNGVLVGYTLVYENNTIQLNSDVTCTNITGLESCSEFQASVTARTHAGEGVPGNVSDVTSGEDPPTNATAVPNSSTDISVFWSPPISSCSVTSYFITWEGDVLWSSAVDPLKSDSVDGSVTQYVLTGLIPYTNYTISLYGDRTSPLSEVVTATTFEDVPGPPVNLTVKGFDSSSITVEWLPPATANGIVTDYEVRWGQDSSHLTGGTTSFTVNDLSDDTIYEISVSAFTKVGKGFPASITQPTEGYVNIGAIVGGVIGGLVLVILLAGGGYYYHSKKKGTQNVSGADNQGFDASKTSKSEDLDLRHSSSSSSSASSK